MRRQASALFAACVTVVSLLVLATPAGAVSGNESFNAVIVASGTSGARVVVGSVVVARGVFTGVGRLVEVDNLPTDPDNVERDDLVFPGGSMHLLSTSVDASFSIDPRTCVFNVTVTQTSQIQGGTGVFAHAAGSGNATVRAQGIAARGPDGGCSPDLPALLDVDVISSTGTLSF